MTQVQLKKSFGPSGNAKITVGNKVVRVALDGEVYELPLTAWDKGRSNGEYNITLSKNMDKIVSLRPPAPGTHIVKFVEFGNRTNEIPEPKIQRGGPRKNKSGGTYLAQDKLVFTCVLEVCDGGEYDGLRLTDTHAYGFEQVPGTQESMITMEGRNDLERLETFMTAQKINLGSVVIPYQTNVLPWLESYMQDVAVPFMVTTDERGFIKTRTPVPAHLLPKKDTKKSKKK